MGRFAEQAEHVLKNRVATGETVSEARQHIQTRCRRSIAEREDAGIDIVRRFEGNPPDEYRKVLANNEHFIALEKEWMREFDNFKDDHFG